MGMNFPDDFDDDEFDEEIGGFFPSDGPEPPSEEELANLAEKSEELDAAAQKLGLYLQTSQIAAATKADGSVELVIMAAFLPGDKAWANKTVDEEAAETEKEFRKLRTSMDEDEFEEYRENLRRQVEGEE